MYRSVYDRSLLTRLARWRVFGGSPLNAYMRLNQWLWKKLPDSVIGLNLTRTYGNFLHTVAQIQSTRGQLFHTFFLRNRATLELVRRLVERHTESDTLRIAVLGCSTGAEAYSIAWRVRSARPDLKLVFYAMDISSDAVKIAESGAYSASSSEFAGSNMFDRMTDSEMDELFDRKGGEFLIKPWIKEGIHWRVGDAADPELFSELGPQDIVVANNFLCHMNTEAAERCLLNIARLVVPSGYLFVSGVDLDVRTKVAEEIGFEPVQELLEDIHDGDPRMGTWWPFNYSALEPLDKRRQDWRIRYAAAFQLPALKRSDSSAPIEMAAANISNNRVTLK
jgi:chemotaxis methyl-accepting protein methylase